MNERRSASVSGRDESCFDVLDNQRKSGDKKMRTAKRITNAWTVAVVAMALGFACASAHAQWVPTDTDSTLAWYDADDASTITLTSGRVTQWNDKSGNAYNATAPAGSALMYTASDANLSSKGSIGYEPANGTVRYLDTPTITAAAQAYIVVHWQDATFEPGSDSYLLNAQSPDTKIHGKVNQTTWDSSSSLNGGVYYRDGSTSTTATALPMTSGAVWRVPFTSRTCTWRIGNDFGPSASETWDEGAVGEIVFTDGAEDLATQQTIEGYLAWKWGLEGALPVAHPYKTDGSLFVAPVATPRDFDLRKVVRMQSAERGIRNPLRGDRLATPGAWCVTH